MKKNLLLFISCLLFISSFAQSKIEIDTRLLSVFPQEKLEHLKLNAPKELAFMNFMLDNAIELIALENLQISTQELTTIQVDDLENLNYYALKLSQHPDSKNYYLIENTELVLLVHSYNNVKEKFKNEIYKK